MDNYKDIKYVSNIAFNGPHIIDITYKCENSFSLNISKETIIPLQDNLKTNDNNKNRQ